MLAWDQLDGWLGLTDEGEIALVTDAADRALAWIETQTGRYFREPREFQIRVRGGRQTYWLPEIPVVEEAESEEVYALVVHEKNAAGEWELVADSEYELIQPDMGRLYEMPTLEFEGCWPDRWAPSWPRTGKNLRFTFTAGYEVGALPGDIQQLVLDMVSAWWADRGKEGLKSESIDGYTYERWASGDGTRFQDDWKSSLTKWKHPVLGRS